MKMQTNATQMPVFEHADGDRREHGEHVWHVAEILVGKVCPLIQKRGHHFSACSCSMDALSTLRLHLGVSFIHTFWTHEVDTV